MYTSSNHKEHTTREYMLVLFRYPIKDKTIAHNTHEGIEEKGSRNRFFEGKDTEKLSFYHIRYVQVQYATLKEWTTRIVPPIYQ